MATEFIIKLPNRPGTLADLCETLGDAGVHIVAIAAYAAGPEGVVRLLADDVANATAALEGAEMPFETREVISISGLDEPGTLAQVARVMFEAGINIEAAYVTTEGRLVIGVDDLDGAREVASGMAVYE
jgi:hypothetical protein